MTWIWFVLMLYFFMVAYKAAMPNPVEGLLEVCEDMVDVSLVLEIFLTKDRRAIHFFKTAKPCSLIN